MSKKSRMIPFWMLPASWGLRGESRKRAEIEYYHDGYSRDTELAALVHSGNDLLIENSRLAVSHALKTKHEHDVYVAELTLSGAELEVKKIEIEYNAGNISLHEYEIQSAAYIESEVDRELAVLGADWREGLISDLEYEKKCATVRKEPWVRVIDDGISDPRFPQSFYMEFDWNDEFIAMLKDNGYSGTDDQSIVQVWFQTLCAESVSGDVINGGVIF